MKLIVGLIVLFMVFVFITTFTGLHIPTGQGEHTGYVTAIEKSGLIFKTGTAYFKTDLSSSQEDVYCVMDQGVYDQLVQASKEKRAITIQHESVFATAINECNSEPAYITGIK